MTSSTVKANSKEIFALAIFSLLPIPIIWFGLYVLHSALLALGLYHVLCLIPVAIWGFRIWQPTLKRPSLIELGLMLIASVAFCCAALFLYRFMGDYLLSSKNTHLLLLQLGYNSKIFVPLSIWFIVGNSTLEELFWRGVILTKFDQLRPDKKYLGITWSSIGYAAFHYSIFRLVLYPGWAEFGTVLLALHGASLAHLYRRTQSIVLPILAHALLTDLCAIVLIFALFRHLGLPSPF